ncbi:DUF2268 domain-containing protein [Oceanobacillus bengalensis]|uniref:Zn-dependent protease n=1 Tax=Oceanobacillus bengalensis TaxID=1435466 RepID=A0A494YV75_9BACI|nr:DUF2268 domain-containing protein [Oceanobacillus bengalensis]RKQ14024.1 Zn-dependent protease [Oceanobacillus bengalensis]
MSIITTDQWLQTDYYQPIKICENIKQYFHNASAKEIYEYLVMHGMYQPIPQGTEQFKTLQENKVWNTINEEFLSLQKEWEGPDIPIFIFPSDSQNTRLKKLSQGKSGLAFKDKLFLFVSQENTEKELKALITHEYNHVCRLTKWEKDEKDYVLLDTIILEGLAENAVLERVGKEYVAEWTSYYAENELSHIWKDLIYPNRNVSKFDFIHQMIVYGLDDYPKMSGYCMGYSLIKKYVKAFKVTSKEMLSMESNTIAQLLLDNDEHHPLL